MGYFKNLWHALSGKKLMLKDRMNIMGAAPSISLDDKYLAPVRFNYWGGMTGAVISTNPANSIEGYSMGTEGYSMVKSENFIPIKPVDVLKELEGIPTIWSLENLDVKLKILRDKAELVSQSYAKRELNDLIQRLENRKKYHAIDSQGKPFKEFFSQFDTTNDKMIDDLLKKYKLVMKDAEIFIPEFPAEAVQVMKEFNEKTKELCGKETKFAVIATSDCFKEVYEKRDPILLAPSPFGFFYYILGAWDQEMQCLSEL